MGADGVPLEATSPPSRHTSSAPCRLYSNTSDFGHSGFALLVCNGTNGWLAQLRQGATTTMEAWNAEEKPNLTWSQ